MVGFETGMRKDMSLEDTIKKKLQERFRPDVLIVENESHKHKGHAGDNGTGESHFKVTIKANELSEVSRVAAHTMVFDCLKNEMESQIHALSISVSR